jgi:hypothetical protein
MSWLTTSAQTSTGSPRIGSSGLSEIASCAYQGQGPSGNVTGPAAARTLIEPVEANPATNTAQAASPVTTTAIAKITRLFFIIPFSFKSTRQLEHTMKFYILLRGAQVLIRSYPLPNKNPSLNHLLRKNTPQFKERRCVIKPYL